jgi:hypothetical protein
MKGDWRKKFLALVKASHLKFWKNKSKITGIDYFAKYPRFSRFSQKVATKKGFVKLYRIEDLRECFEEYFRNNGLSIDLMLSNRLKTETKNAYVGSLGKFYQAFLSLVFKSIQ